MAATIDLDALAVRGTNVFRMGEAHARARYCDLDSATPTDAFVVGFRDGAAATLDQLQSAVLGLSDFEEYLARMCDPDSVPGSASTDMSAPWWSAAGPAAGTEFRQSLEHQARAYAGEAGDATPTDAYVRGFKHGALAALHQAAQAATVLRDFHEALRDDPGRTSCRPKARA